MAASSFRLPFYSAYTLRRHLPAAACEGAVFAIVSGLSDVVMTKGLGAGAGYVTALTILFPSALLLAGAWSGLMVGRSKAPFFLGAGVLGRLPLLCMPLVDGPLGFLAVIVPSAAAYAVIIPAQNAMMQANYPTAVRGRIFALAQMVQALASVITALGLGWVLEHDERAYRAVYPLAGVLGLLSCWLMARIKVRGERRRWGADARARLRASQAIAETWASTRRSFAILREEPAFRRYEVGFSLYGAAFMTLQPIIPLYLVNHLHASYLEAAVAKQGVFGVLQLLCLPYLGRVVDKLGPIRAGARFFALLALFPVALALSGRMTTAYVAFAIYGGAMAGVALLWNLASIHFARERDSAPFQGVHVALVGIRGLIAPFLGYAALSIGMPRLGMALSAALLLVASGVLVALERSLRAAAGAAGSPLTSAATASGSVSAPAPAPASVAPVAPAPAASGAAVSE